LIKDISGVSPFILTISTRTSSAFPVRQFSPDYAHNGRAGAEARMTLKRFTRR
jgi:hypothetical protein